ncbi:MAG: FtsX-like permease family protein, partial [Planctomycetota bacterium]
VAAFLLNVVITRQINTQREQIAALKAFGYGKWAIASHYLKMVILIPCVGTLIGTLVGSWMGHGLTQMYAQFYRFPVFTFQPAFSVIMLALGLSTLAGVIGTLAAVRRAVQLAPAEAMRPEPPPDYKPTLVERWGLAEWLPQTTRMILRNLERRPIKAVFSILGIGMAVSVLILGSFMLDAVTYIMDFQFRIQQRQDLVVSFVEPSSSRSIHEVTHLPGVRRVEAFRGIPVRLRFKHRHKRTSILGLVAQPTLYRVLDDRERVFAIPAEGLVLSHKLGELLGVQVGDLVTVEVQEGERPVREVMVAGLVREFSGLNAYMSLPAMHRLMSEGDVASGAYVTVDERDLDELYLTLKNTPRVAGVSIKGAMISSFEDTVAENLLRMRFFNMLFATIIAFGVVYNGARISLAERTRELSTLRVIGFTRAEISGILLGELVILTLLGIPLGLLLGYLFAAWAVTGLDTEIYRIPLVVAPRTFAYAAVTVLVATAMSGLIVRRRLDELDLVSVLKSKE